MQFLERGQWQPCAGRTNRMAKRDCAAVDVEFVLGHFAERLIAAQKLAGKFLRLGRLFDSQRLCGEGFVDFDEISVTELESALSFSAGDGEYRAEPHAARIATSIS